MTEPTQPSQEPEQWDLDEAVGEVRLWRDECYTLRLKARLEDETYQAGQDEIAPLKQSGVRTTVHAIPYVLIPDIWLTLAPPPIRDPAYFISEVRASAWEGMKHEDLGACEAAFYAEDRLIVVGAVYLDSRFRAANILEDSNTRALWEGFERFLLQRFPSTRQIVTASKHSEYVPLRQYQEFLASMGYQQINHRAWGKEIPG